MNDVDSRGSGPKDRDTSRAPRKVKKRPGEILRERVLYAAPTIIIVYPIVGYFIGYLSVRYLGWPIWVPMITTLMGLAQAIIEIARLSRRVYGKERNEESNANDSERAARSGRRRS